MQSRLIFNFLQLMVVDSAVALWGPSQCQDPYTESLLKVVMFVFRRGVCLRVPLQYTVPPVNVNKRVPSKVQELATYL